MECACGNICHNDDISFICESCHDDIQIEYELEREHMKKLSIIYFCINHIHKVRFGSTSSESQIIAWRFSMGYE